MSPATVTELVPFEAFWTRRPVLTHILEFARSRRAGPWAVLGVVCARAVAATEPPVALPPTIGTAVSLNLLIALVGKSGAGKGAAEGAARDALRFVDYNGTPITTDEFPLGSGEGIARTFRQAGADEDEPLERTRALFTVPEVDTLAALGARQGSTLMPELRKLYMGEQLGFNNASKSTRSTLPAHSYRACLTIGAQPAKAGPLLHDADGGTPQRINWLPVGDPDAPDTPPETPEPWTVKAPRWGAGLTYLEVPEVARSTMDAHRLATLRGEEVNPLDGHRMLTRLKVAAALMLLEGRSIITDEDWELAGVVMRVSDRTRASIERSLAERARAANRARAHEKAEQEAIVADRASERIRQRARDAVIRVLERRGRCSRKQLRGDMRHELRRELDATLVDLLDEGHISEFGGEYVLAGGYGGTACTPHGNAH